ncbi:MAG: BrnT family toxin [Thermacetogeniaceae bacterium]
MDIAKSLQSVYTFVYNMFMESIQVSGLQWDKNNRAKCQQHGVSIEAIESLFQNPVAILPDEIHSQEEQRFRAIGKAEDGRSVFVVFTLRKHGEDTFIRPISARYMHKKEVTAYEEENPGL